SGRGDRLAVGARVAGRGVDAVSPQAAAGGAGGAGRRTGDGQEAGQPDYAGSAASAAQARRRGRDGGRRADTGRRAARRADLRGANRERVMALNDVIDAALLVIGLAGFAGSLMGRQPFINLSRMETLGGQVGQRTIR